MMEFKKVSPADRVWMQKAVSDAGRFSCEFSFGNLFSWGNSAGITAAEVCGTLICKMGNGYSLPMGQNRDEAFERLMALPKKAPWQLFGVSESDFDWLSRKIGAFTPRYERAWSDYIYSTDSLAGLKGKKLAAKRNHINAFLREHPVWHTEDITPQNMPAVRAFRRRWIEQNAAHGDESFRYELQMSEMMLEHFFEIGLQGLVLYAGEDIVAFSFGEPISPDCYCVHVEKALAQVRGAYPLINREFVRRYCGGYGYVNREDDSGEPGLRQAKLSYEPAMILHKYEITMEK